MRCQHRYETGSGGSNEHVAGWDCQCGTARPSNDKEIGSLQQRTGLYLREFDGRMVRTGAVGVVEKRAGLGVVDDALIGDILASKPSLFLREFQNEPERQKKAPESSARALLPSDERACSSRRHGRYRRRSCARAGTGRPPPRNRGPMSAFFAPSLALKMKVSSPALPVRTSLPRPPLRRSSPSPPTSRSARLPPVRVRDVERRAALALERVLTGVGTPAAFWLDRSGTMGPVGFGLSVRGGRVRSCRESNDAIVENREFDARSAYRLRHRMPIVT